MTVTRSLAVLLVVAVMTGGAADDKVDPSTPKDKVTIDLGKTLIVQFEQKGDALTHPKVVEKAAEEPPTPTFDFRKMGGNIILTTKNPFPKDLKFRALARVKGSKDYFE